MIADTINKTARRIPTWVIYLATAVWAGWMFWLGATNQLGPEPINTLEREYGEMALIILVAGLAITPLRNLLSINLIKFRRAIGLSAFFLVLCHFLVWALLDVQSLERVWADILKRPYVTIGMAGFLCLIPLAITSNDLSVRKLGAASWRKLHKLTYPAVLLGVAHYIWLVKGFPFEPLIYLGAAAGLLATRGKWLRRRRQAA